MTGSVIELRPFLHCASITTLVVMDAQRDYVDRHEVLSAPETIAGIANCRAALAHARQVGIRVAFTRWRGRSLFFDGGTKRLNWLDEFVPRASEMIFERDQPSCYANPHFAEAMSLDGGRFVLAGFGSEIGCLATAIDAHHRGHRFVFLSDASVCLGILDGSTKAVHDTVSRLVALYDPVIDTERWISITSNLAVRRALGA